MDINVIETETNQNQELITNIEEIVSSRERVNSLKREANDNIRIFNNCILTVNMRREEIVDYLVEISEDEKYPAIVLPLLNIQQVAKGKNKDYKFNFLEFVSNCLKLKLIKIL